jgi:membrane-associated protease RseP (regulator of RpoE activity)
MNRCNASQLPERSSIMKSRTAWTLTAAFLFSLMVPTLPAQDQPGQNQDADIKSQSKGNSQSKGSQIVQKSSGQQGRWLINGKNLWSSGGPQGELLNWSTYPQAIPLSLSPVDDSLRAHLGLPDGEGIVVTAIDPNSSAAQTGIQINDILLKLGDAKLSSVESFYKHLKEIGEKPVGLTLLRDGQSHTIQVQPKINVTLHPVATKTPPREFWIGVSVTAIEPALRAQLKLPPQGLIVNDVSDDSPAARSGIKHYDIIQDVDGEHLTEPAALAAYVQSVGEKAIVLHLLRGGKRSLHVTVTPERRKPAPESSAVQPQDPSYYTVFQPGAVLYDPRNAAAPLLTVPTQPGGGTIRPVPADPYSITWENVYTLPSYPSAQPVARPDPNSALTSRLDTLDAELKELRAAVAQFNETAKAIEQLKTAIEALKDKN